MYEGENVGLQLREEMLAYINAEFSLHVSLMSVRRERPGHGMNERHRRAAYCAKYDRRANAGLRVARPCPAPRFASERGSGNLEESKPRAIVHDAFELLCNGGGCLVGEIA